MYFEKCNDPNELKAAYKKLALENHLDMGGDVRVMQQINAEYDRMFLLLKAKQNTMANEDETGKTRRTTETPEEFRSVVEALLKLDGIEVELCGAWIWISGGTYPNREALKAFGCLWSRSKARWYWRHAEDDCHWSRGKTSMGEIRHKYGSEWLERRKEDEREKLPA